MPKYYRGSAGDMAVLTDLKRLCIRTFSSPKISGPLKTHYDLGSRGPLLTVDGLGSIALVSSMTLGNARLITVALTDNHKLGELQTRFEVEILKTETQDILPFIAQLACDSGVVEAGDCVVPLARHDYDPSKNTRHCISQGLYDKIKKKNKYYDTFSEKGQDLPFHAWLHWRRKRLALRRAV